MQKGIRQLPSGSWRLRFTDGDGTQSSRTFGTLEDAVAFRDAIRPALMRGQSVRKIKPSRLIDGPHVRIPAKGHYVYLLEAEDETVLYVGRSSNVIKRLGDHLHVKGRRAVVAHASIIRCNDVAEMKQLEMALIFKHQPPMNTRGLLGRPKRGEPLCHKSDTNPA